MFFFRELEMFFFGNSVWFFFGNSDDCFFETHIFYSSSWYVFGLSWFFFRYSWFLFGNFIFCSGNFTLLFWKLRIYYVTRPTGPGAFDKTLLSMATLASPGRTQETIISKRNLQMDFTRAEQKDPKGTKIWIQFWSTRVFQKEEGQQWDLEQQSTVFARSGLSEKLHFGDASWSFFEPEVFLRGI